MFRNLKIHRVLTDSDGAKVLSNTSQMALSSRVLLSAGVSGILYIIKPCVLFLTFEFVSLDLSCVSVPKLKVIALERQIPGPGWHSTNPFERTGRRDQQPAYEKFSGFTGIWTIAKRLANSKHIANIQRGSACRSEKLPAGEPNQRRSTKLVKGLQDIEYEERAQLLNLDSLSCRMDKEDMILVYKILHGLLEGVQWQDFFQMADTSRLRGHPLKLRKDRSRLDLRICGMTCPQKLLRLHP